MQNNQGILEKKKLKPSFKVGLICYLGVQAIDQSSGVRCQDS